MKYINLLLVLFFMTFSLNGFSRPQFQVGDLKKFKRILGSDLIFKSMALIQGKRSQGTGVFVSPYHVLTATHVIDKMDCETEIEITTQRLSGSKNPTGGRTVGCDEVIFLDTTYDVALIVTDRAVKDFMPLRRASISKNMSIFSIGYTIEAYIGLGDQCKITQLQGPNRQMDVGGMKLNYRNFYISDCIVTPGMSGGPVIAYDNYRQFPEVVGLNNLFLKSDEFGNEPVASGLAQLKNVYEKYSSDFEEVFSYQEERWGDQLQFYDLYLTQY